SPLSKLTLTSSGTIKNGTVVDTGSGLVAANGTLDGVTYQGALDMSAASSVLYLKDGFTGGSGGATINLTGTSSTLYSQDTETLDNATLNIGNDS
ncbi:hypothetical protein WN73_11105, partial [Bradyrhizobium sp. CCBAU 45394]|uniref:hypothetical protein n=1 Tax=Bradyrhizobium sp. CCBAU 45394 TaxID=1325087 RepID=UPI002302697F